MLTVRSADLNGQCGVTTATVRSWYRSNPTHFPSPELGCDVTSSDWHVDHIVPAKQGGMGWVSNHFLMPKVSISNRFSFHTTKMIVLPRQARDKLRNTQRKETRFCTGGQPVEGSLPRQGGARVRWEEGLQHSHEIRPTHHLLGASALHSTSLLRSPRLIACNSRLSRYALQGKSWVGQQPGVLRDYNPALAEHLTASRR